MAASPCAVCGLRPATVQLVSPSDANPSPAGTLYCDDCAASTPASTFDPLASCASIDLEPLARAERHWPRQLRDQVAQLAAAAREPDTVRACPLCHQLANLSEQLVCPSCKRAADLAAGGTQQHLFTPLRPQLRGQEGLF